MKKIIMIIKKTRKLQLKALLAVWLLHTFAACSTSEPEKYDVCIYGGTPAGIIAAVQAARMDKKVLLLVPDGKLGGVMTSGLTATDMNRYKAVGGVAREVFQRIYDYYKKPEVWKNQTRDEFFKLSEKRTYTGKNDSLGMQWVYESHVLEDIYQTMLKEEDVEVKLHQRLDRQGGVIKNGNAIGGIVTTEGQVYHAQMFVDASYEGDLMATAGVEYVVGREAASQYDEVRAGFRLDRKTYPFDPFVVEGDPDSGLLPFVEAYEGQQAGDGDHKVQAYTYRVTLTNDPANRLPIPKPANYNPLWFELVARRFAAQPETTLANVLTITPMPNKKTDTNHLDFVAASYNWAEADYTSRDSIAQMHRDYALGKLWFLGNDTRVPEAIRNEVREWGLAKDEFSDNEHFPHQLYVREARRMVSSIVMTEKNCRARDREDVPFPVGLGTYAFDSHYVAHVFDGDSLRIEGSFFGAASIYPISYLSIVPKKEECTNLLVPICMSASHVAYSSIRMEPVFMLLGQSAGTAAALAIDHGHALQDLPYAMLEDRLLQDGQILDHTLDMQN